MLFWKLKLKLTIALVTVAVIGIGGLLLYKEYQSLAGEKFVMAGTEEVEMKIITLEDVKGSFDEKSIKITGREETGRMMSFKMRELITQEELEKDGGIFGMLGKVLSLTETHEDDSLWEKALKSQFGSLVEEAAKREFVVMFPIDYGVGYDMEPALEYDTLVNEYSGAVQIRTPDLIFTNFYIDPTFSEKEENGWLVKLFGKEFNEEQKNYLIKQAEVKAKEQILEENMANGIAEENVQEKVENLIKLGNPDAKVSFVKK